MNYQFLSPTPSVSVHLIGVETVCHELTITSWKKVDLKRRRFKIETNRKIWPNNRNVETLVVKTGQFL